MKYIFPPRPETAINPSQLSYYEKRGWIGQIKKNGTCVVINIDNGVEVWNRHEQKLKYDMPEGMNKLLRDIPDRTILVGELLHFKTKHLKNTLYLFDILVHADDSLTGMLLNDRLAILESLLPATNGIGPGYLNYGWGVWMSRPIKDFDKTFKSLSSDEDEGLVLKNPTGKLKDGDKPNSNSLWQVKCRRPTKNYGW